MSTWCSISFCARAHRVNELEETAIALILGPDDPITLSTSSCAMVFNTGNHLGIGGSDRFLFALGWSVRHELCGQGHGASGGRRVVTCFAAKERSEFWRWS